MRSTKAVGLIIIILLIGIIIFHYSKYFWGEDKVILTSSEAYKADITLESYRLWSEKNRISIDDVKQEYHAIAIQMNDYTCIALKLSPPFIGGEPLYCFNQNDELVQVFDRVE